MLPKPDMPQPAVTVDPKPGGRFKIDMDVGDKILPHEGEFLKIDRHSLIVFTWESPFSADNSEVSITFRGIEENATEVVLTHTRFVSEESRDNHQGGWRNILNALNRLS